MECRELKKKLDKLVSDRTTVQEQWELVREYVVPYRGEFFKGTTGEHGVDWRENRRVYDSTAINANNILASSLHGAITNPTHQWFDFRFRSNDLVEQKEAAQWLHEASVITFETIRDSNFNLQVNEAYIDFTAFGTAFITREVLEDDSGNFQDFLFQSAPLIECYFEQDYRGRVRTFYRKMQWSATQVLSKFGDKTPEEIRKKAEKAISTEADICVVMAVYRRDHISEDNTRPAAPQMRPYGYKYFLEKDGTQLGDEGGYYTMPALVMRWRKTADSMWGNSPAMVAMPDILTLNELVSLILKSLEKVVDPPILTTERGLISDLDLGPAGVNVLRKIDEMVPFESRARFDVAELNRNNLQSSIRSIFYVDQLELKESPAMTATEVQVRFELMQRLLGPTLGRLESDFLDPLVSSVFADLVRYKRIPPPPDSIGMAADPTINIEYTGPMARAQKLDRAQSLLQFTGAAAQMGEINPEIMEKIDWDEAIDLLAQYYQVEPKVMKAAAIVKRERKQRQQMQERQQQAEIAATEGKAEESFAKAAPPAANGGR